MTGRPAHSPGQRVLWGIAFLVWLSAGLGGLAFVGQQLFGIDADVYALNGTDHAVTVSSAGRMLVTLQPDESTLIRLTRSGVSLDVIGTGLSEQFGPVESGVSILNVGDRYHVSHDRVSYSSIPTQDFEGDHVDGQQGLYSVSQFNMPPWLVYGFDSTPPGTVTEGNSDSRLDLMAESPTRRKPVERRHLLNSEMMHEFGWIGVLVPLAVLFTIWGLGLKFLGVACVTGLAVAMAGIREQ